MVFGLGGRVHCPRNQLFWTLETPNDPKQFKKFTNPLKWHAWKPKNLELHLLLNSLVKTWTGNSWRSVLYFENLEYGIHILQNTKWKCGIEYGINIIKTWNVANTLFRANPTDILHSRDVSTCMFPALLAAMNKDTNTNTNTDTLNDNDEGNNDMNTAERKRTKQEKVSSSASSHTPIATQAPKLDGHNRVLHLKKKEKDTFTLDQFTSAFLLLMECPTICNVAL